MSNGDNRNLALLRNVVVRIFFTDRHKKNSINLMTAQRVDTLFFLLEIAARIAQQDIVAVQIRRLFDRFQHGCKVGIVHVRDDKPQ